MNTHRHSPSELQAGDYPYFRRLWNTIVSALIGAAFIPLILIGGGMYYFAASALKESLMQSLRTEARHQKEAADLYIAERAGDLRLVNSAMDLSELLHPEAMEEALASLNAGGDFYSDLGVVDAQGRHLAHAGPAELLRENDEFRDWLETVNEHKVHISDVFLDFRSLPHFGLAVKQRDGERILVLRATVNASYFQDLIGEVTEKAGGGFFLVDEEGEFQAGSGIGRQNLELFRVLVSERFDGTRVAEHDGLIYAMVWLENVPWMSVVQVDKKKLFKQIRRIRNIDIFVFILGAILIVFTALLTTNHLVSRLEVKRRNIRVMGYHLRQANRMTLSLMLYRGFFQEINEALNNIDSAASWIGEQARKIAEKEEARCDLDENLGQIKSEIHRSRETISQLISLGRPTVPAVTDIDVNGVLKGLIGLFHWEIHFKNIRIKEDFQEPPPIIRGDPSQLEQVIQNLVVNALDAIEKDGEIVLQTRSHVDYVHVTVIDDGPGIAPGITEKIFNSPYTTRPGRLGLGLAICRELLNKMGGEIKVDSQPGKGAAFTASFPVRFKPQ